MAECSPFTNLYVMESASEVDLMARDGLSFNVTVWAVNGSALPQCPHKYTVRQLWKREIELSKCISEGSHRIFTRDKALYLVVIDDVPLSDSLDPTTVLVSMR